MKTKVLLFLFCLLTLNVMGQGTIKYQPKQTTTQKSSGGGQKKKNTGSSGTKKQPVSKPAAEDAGYDVSFTCNVSSATLYIDGIANGTASGSRFLKTGSHSIKLSANGYEDYTRSITVNRQNTAFSFSMTKKAEPARQQSQQPSNSSKQALSPDNNVSLIDYLTGPMGRKVNSLPDMTRQGIKSLLAGSYTIDEERGFYIWSSGNPNLKNNVYHGIPLYYFSCDFKENDKIYRMHYKFEIESNKKTESQMYDILDEIVKDFHRIGINIQYQRIDEQYTKATGEIIYGDSKYKIVLEKVGAWRIDIYRMVNG